MILTFKKTGFTLRKVLPPTSQHQDLSTTLENEDFT